MPRPREKGPMFWRGAIAVMLATVFGAFAVAAFNAPPALDADTQCRVDRKDPAHTILLIDQSDPFSTNDLAWVDALLDEEARNLPRYGRLTVVLPEGDGPMQARTLFSQCSPGSIQDANPILQNPRMVDDTWRESFFQPLAGKVSDTLQTKSLPRSPLFEALYTIGDRVDFQSRYENRRLVIVSDLMQHSEDFSFYKSGADTAAFKESKLATLTPDFTGVEIVARIVPRENYDLPLLDLKAFWRGYFEETGTSFAAAQ